MGSLMVEIWDATGNKKVKAELPDDEAVNRILILLIDRMSLPRFTPDGQLMSYKFHHKASGRQLLDDESLHQAGVQAGDVLRIQPEITAGRLP
ncbi:MAG TPA: EsaB/YukD family protein [Candidatus Ozemobacteraceae bacterium]|nr:EsaB/YukD family protein [Candidatus Ozemobacteraceae bacterium]